MKNKKPEIRFKGFSEEWEEKELGVEVKITMGQSPNGENYTNNPENSILVQGNADMKNGKVVPRVWTKQITKTANSNDLIFSVRAPVGEVGKTDYDVVIGRGVAAIEGNEFIFQSLIKKNENGYWNQFSAGSTFDSINSNDLSKAIISTTSKTEQTQIGNFFKNLDNLITLHQRKYEKLEILKKAMLEKMFPKNGKNVPEIRFKGFEGAWKGKTLGEITDVLDGDRGKNYPNGDELKSMGHTLFLSATNVTINGFRFDNNQYITEEKSNSMGNGKLIVNDIVLTSRGSIGHIAWYNENVQQEIPFARINSGMLILRYKDFMIPSFISQFLKSPLGKQQINLISFGSAQPQLTKKDISNYSVAFPNYEEQEKIGNYFENLDKLLSLHQGELGKLKNLKKAMLEKMFV